MLGGWGSASVYNKLRRNNVDDKLLTLFSLLDSFNPEEKEKILEILKLALEIVHSPFKA